MESRLARARSSIAKGYLGDFSQHSGSTHLHDPCYF